MADEQTPLLHDVEGHNSKPPGYNLKGLFSPLLATYMLAMLVLYYLFADYPSASDISENYYWYIHVAVMIYVGFGFLMTFLRRYTLAAVSLNFLTSCLMALGVVLMLGLLRGRGQRFAVDMGLLIEGLFGAGAGMITFGAVLGKASPTQVALLLILEVPFYVLNAEYVVGMEGVKDVGGSLAIHSFGAYFGLAASMFISTAAHKAHPKNEASHLNDVTSMIGTIFLWIYWPSFNASTANEEERIFAATHTVLSLMAACITTFALAPHFHHGKLSMEAIQNATLAGGVAVGSCATLRIGPGGALLIGKLAGALSTFGFCKIGGFLEKRIGLQDTCGVHNLHGMPGIFGGLAAVVVMAAQGLAYPAQALATGVTLGGAIVTGGLCGFLVSLVDRAPPDEAKRLAFEDAAAISEQEYEDVDE